MSDVVFATIGAIFLAVLFGPVVFDFISVQCFHKDFQLGERRSRMVDMIIDFVEDSIDDLIVYGIFIAFLLGILFALVKVVKVFWAW